MIEIPEFEIFDFVQMVNKYCLCIPIINEGERIISQLKGIQALSLDKMVDVILCDGGSSDGSTNHEIIKNLGVNTLLVKTSEGKLSAQLRMGYWWALQRGYKGIITVDGNGKDSMQSIPLFIDKLDEGFDLIQGSRFIEGGGAINTPLSRHLALKLIHAPIISLVAGFHFTDTTNGYRGYSKRYLEHPDVQPFRKIFVTYELLAYLSVRATKLKLRAVEVPVVRAYPEKGKAPTKISAVRGNSYLLRILFNTLLGKYNP